VAPPAPGTHIDQVVAEVQTIEPAVQEPPEAGAAGAEAAGAGAAGLAGAEDLAGGTGTTTFPDDGADDGAGFVGEAAGLVALG